jgi:hypothetical protein
MKVSHVKQKKESNSAQVSLDFLVGISIFLFTFMFVAQFIPNMFIPFESESEVTTLLADAASTRLVENYLVIDPSEPNVISKTQINEFLDNELDDANITATKNMLGLNISGSSYQRLYSLNASITYLNGTEKTNGDTLDSYVPIGQTSRVVGIARTGYGTIRGSELSNCSNGHDPSFYINRSTSGVDAEGGSLTSLPANESIEIIISYFNISGTTTSYNPSGLKLCKSSDVVCPSNSSDEVWLSYINKTGQGSFSIRSGEKLKVVFKSANVTRKFPNNETTYNVTLDFDDNNWCGDPTGEPLDLTSYVQAVREAARLIVRVW